MPLAQLNLAPMRYPLDDPRMASFVDQIAEVNAAAEAADGFLWRLADDGPGSTSFRILDRDDLLVNLSVWRDLPSLRAFVLGFAQHRTLLQDRGQWFERPGEPMTVCWEVSAGHVPTLAEAEGQLLQLRAQGPSKAVFPYAHRD